MKNIVWLTFLVLLLSSCNQYKRFTYLQAPIVERDSFYTNKLTPYKLQPNDNLYIKITSPVDKATEELFTSKTEGTSSMFGGQGGGLYLMGYIVDIEGFIYLPVLGKIHVSGNTVDEVRQKVQDLVGKMSSNMHVEIKLLSFKVAVLGEINSPGQLTVLSDRANILEVLAMAGDLSYNGNRKKILILRSYENGTQPIEVDLTKRSLLKSDLYYLKPNDIIYIEPYKTTAFRMRIAEYSQFLTLITSTITAVLLINNAL